MKKVLLTAMTILSVASASVFGMYGNNSDWIDFLVHGNQLRARMNQFGVTIGNGTIKGTVGFKANTDNFGGIFSSIVGDKTHEREIKLDSTISAGIGYTSPAFGIGVGYNYTWVDKNIGIHTPVLTINALNDNLRIAIPFQIASSSSLEKTAMRNGASASKDNKDNKDYMGLSTEAQIRYYTGIDAFNAIRLYIKYGQAGYKNTAGNKTTEYAQSSFGFDARFYFLNMPVGNVQINPFIKVTYDTALTGNNYEVTAGSYKDIAQKDAKYDRLPYRVQALAVLGITANSDIVNLYVEPSIGYKAAASAVKKDEKNPTDIEHSLAWNAYGEIYITPVKDLEWYFEAEVGNNLMAKSFGDDGITPTGFAKNPVQFAASTGITWYLPSFGGDAQ